MIRISKANKKTKKRILAIAMTGIITVMCFATTFAYDSTSTSNTTSTTSTTSTSQQATGGAVQKPPVSKTELDKLVKAGTITQAQETAVIKLLDSTTKSYEEALNGLVTENTITQAQKAAIESAIKPSGAQTGQQGTPPTGNQPSGSTASSSISTGTAVYTLSAKKATKTNQTIKATKKDQSGIKVTKAGSLTITGSTITKTGDTSSEDNSNFYGLNAGVLAESGSKITIKNTSITTNSNGSNAIFATGTGSKITVANVKIKTTADSSRGLDATLKGTVIATNVDISTKGIHCAALATDRGNGTVSLTGGTIVTSGKDSPGIYSTGTISATNAKITATGSEAAVIEGKNSITLKNTTISGAAKRGVMLYQSFSGDAEVGTSKFTMNGGSLKAAVGPLFYATNTDAIVELNGAKISGASGTLISASADSWGTKGSNGATLTFNANNETLAGNIICDKISTITVSLKKNTTLTSTINKANTAKALVLNQDKTRKWTVTGTSYLTSLTDTDTTLSNIKDNGNTIYYNSGDKANSWLNGKTITLQDGGKLTPAK